MQAQLVTKKNREIIIVEAGPREVDAAQRHGDSLAALQQREGGAPRYSVAGKQGADDPAVDERHEVIFFCRWNEFSRLDLPAIFVDHAQQDFTVIEAAIFRADGQYILVEKV